MPVLVNTELGRQRLSQTAQLVPDGDQAMAVPHPPYSCCFCQRVVRSPRMGAQHEARKLRYKDWFKTPCRTVIDLMTSYKFIQGQDTQSGLVSMATQLLPPPQPALCLEAARTNG